MAHVVPAFLSDLHRPSLWRGSAIGALLVLGLLGTLVATASLEPQKPPGIDRVLRQAGMLLMLTVAAVLGSFSFTSDYRSGCFTRRVLLFQRGAAFAGRAAATALAALVMGATVGVLFGLSGELPDGLRGFNFPAVLGFAGMAGMGALWGFAVGSLIRSHLVSLFVVPLTLVVPELLSGSLGQAKQFLFPVLAADWADHVAFHIPASGSFVGVASWLLVVTAVAFGAFLKRDLA